MRAIAMGFPPALWFEDTPGDVTLAAPEGVQDLAARVGHLFAVVPGCLVLSPRVPRS
jgi:hypothetical protein